MSDADRIDRLERRLLLLEEQVGELAGQRGGGAAGYGASTRVAGEAGEQEPKPAPSPDAEPASPAQTNRPIRLPSPPLSSEQWIGQRLLLAIGVVALILAAGYLLRLSFDRGWISPIMRCVGGTVAGIVVGAVGWRLHPRYRTYGAALVGCGAAIIYLCVWAAARLYEVLPPTTGIVGLALVSVALAMIAYSIDVEALGTTAALGAFFAPLLLGRDSTHADMLLLYLSSMAVGLGWVAARRRWRQTMAVVAVSFFGVAYAGAADRGTPWAVLVYGVVGGSVGIHIGLRERWWETRLLSFTGGWTLLGAASHRLDHPVAVLVAGVILAAPVWLYGLGSDRVLPRWRRSGGEPGWSPGEAFYFFVTPLLLGWAVHGLSPRWFDREPGAVALAVAIPYLIAGYQKPRPAFALVGAAALGLSAWLHWDGVARVAALLGLAILWASLDHPLTRTDGRWYALGTLWAGLDHQFGGAELSRKASDPAFVGSWALTLWGLAVGTAALAAGLWSRAGETNATQLIRGGLWALGGALALFGVTGEIQRYFALRTLSAETASLASGLAVSAWWLVFAAALVAVGFRRALKPVRVAGLGVAGLAVVKVLVFDLSSLDALYRVGSVFILGLVFLLLAYLYHRQGRATEGRGAESVS